MNIRPATRADAIAVNELLGQLGYPQDGADATADRIQVWADDPALAAYVAESDGDVLGVIAVHVAPFFQRDGSWARIVALVVSNQARRQGIATQLMAAAESFAADRGCVRIDLNSANDRHDAHAFYQDLGYVEQTDTSTRFLRSLPQPG
ncbi:putative N-acetyltransferase YhbS [Kribbella rubisoli]|uniref:N-acetyltransferase YhbS n=1 Tax=Kribbella rubisoli TaxID=3075929 RepID=A0A4Q7WKY9_9ACTN|nr:GNAT family N-acetyltransferase [Kribbella rubisoli]RZU10205.1 putative N-acetyltransferase YhbS [Kribbella rubisoli]